MKKNIFIIISAAVLVVVAGGAFYGGMLFQQNQQRAAFQNRAGGNANIRFQAGQNVVSGDVTAKDSQSITVKTGDGSSRIIFYSDTTDVGKFVSGNTGDISVGSTVMITGKQNSDGSITAQSIQIRPAGQPGPGGPGGGSQSSQ